tara:strand:+ start:100 stop:699 length:600 start_codon:yes stop_codon:yes gene_type:complete
MKLLMENWREYLNEGTEAKWINKMEEYPDLIVASTKAGSGYTIFYTTEQILEELGAKASGMKGHGMMRKLGLPYGSIELDKSSGANLPKSMGGGAYGGCSDAFHVGIVNSLSGWGPLLYDVAMEIATQEGAGLIPDRQKVSGDAGKVWTFYATKRAKADEVDIQPLENCIEIPGASYMNKLYSKKPALIQALGNRYRKV